MDLKELKRGGRRMMIILLVLGCIQYAAAAAGDAPTDPKIKVEVTIPSPGGTTEIKPSLYSVAANETATLTCSADDPDTATSMQFYFVKGTTMLRTWANADDVQVTEFDRTKADKYSCKAKESDSATKESVLADAIALTLACSKDEDCGSDDKVTTCDTDKKDYEFCKCKINIQGVFPAGCDACSKSEDCGANQVCEGSPKACACGTYGGKLPKCNACNVTTHQGCEATSAKPRCASTSTTPSECTGCDNKFCEKFGKGKPECDTSKGSCKAKTSGAATVTSTAFVAIASIFVALIN